MALGDEVYGHPAFMQGDVGVRLDGIKQGVVAAACLQHLLHGLCGARCGRLRG